jgi:hypothetical protein
MERSARRALALGARAAAAALALSACAGGRDEGDAAEEERARSAAAEVAKNCHNPDAPNEVLRAAPGRRDTAL